jgi:hypothetical protein
MSELCTYLLKFSTVKFTSSLSEDNRTHYSSLLYEKDINSVCDIYGNTPLHLAWMSGQSHLIVPLLKLGALYVRNNIQCYSELGLFPQQMAIIIDHLWRVEILDPEGSRAIEDSILIESEKNILFKENFTISTQENIESYKVFFARHSENAFYEDVCGFSCDIIQKMMSGEINCAWFIENV